MINKINKKILVIGGPTGVGESAVTKKIIEKYPVFTRLVTATTRKPRKKEKYGKDYYFFTNNKFREEIKKGNILEYQNTRNKNIYYGTFKIDLENKLLKGYNIIVNPDITGVRYYKKKYNAISIFIMPDNFNNLIKRLKKRDAKISQEELNERINYAKYEIKKEAPLYDYKVINKQNKLENTVNKITKIIKNEKYI
ncbi:guanylate kinase [Candidatus Falkowbacteria bacterium CG_4_9_14_3_um_filter_36_9]|uniref:Guanylate kinase n=1 Tax=Candidatus Falkowbacteria bacterium CG02_land_8_20_14_3_00_36_14 TaxID=1974560 RepID=A0A2M7DNB6_9BACT|nr:MAG: guanylate kinase [Candidatus Falkowbacteria bacterium CG02_land_8_20_14_3_00_36_14]PJA10024.1 MAG: guanylate kinase [Candidatus Falkowbacteria bacterium CG_4_10_14_0_2_um_filter_36_22]PJB17885.1 MAG: guanylate kinase [Candidatus Falkowbacteria bacterium CG_4_9_14_3_um_filter_36_9]